MQQLKIDNLKTEKLSGLKVDGASVNVGIHHSVITSLRVIIPELIVIKCFCHSLHLAAEDACKVLPRHLDFMVRETYTWFSISTKRQIEYAEVYQTLESKAPKKIVKLSNTRWLVRLQAVNAILEQWDALQLHFEITENNKERCYIACQLHIMFSTPEHKLYLTFLSSTLKAIIGLNRLFQSDSVNPVKLFKDLTDSIYSLLQTLFVPSQLKKILHHDLASFDFKPFCMSLECIDFGYEFNVLTASVHRESVVLVKQRCKDFLIVLISELQKRVPENIRILEQMSTFSLESASSQVKVDITSIAAEFKNSLCNDISSTVKEWNMLHRAEIIDVSNTERFWAEVNELTDAGGNKKFGNISKLVLGSLSLFFSNAAVERAFSIVNIVKDKLRNCMSIAMVEAILQVRSTLDIDCCNFKPTAAMLKRFHSETVYKRINDDDIRILDDLPSE